MTDELQHKIDNCWDSTELEDIYLPYKPKRDVRRRKSLANRVWNPRHAHDAAKRKQSGKRCKTVCARRCKRCGSRNQGAQDIIAETINEDERPDSNSDAFKREAVIIESDKTKKIQTRRLNIRITLISANL